MVRSKCSPLWADVTQGRDDDSDKEMMQNMEIMIVSWVVKYPQRMLMIL